MRRQTAAGPTHTTLSRPNKGQKKQGDGSAVSLINETAEPSPCFT